MSETSRRERPERSHASTPEAGATRKPDDKPDHPHGTPHGEDPYFVPPGHGGVPPGQGDKPDKPDKPEEGEPQPEHPIVTPDDEPQPAPQARAAQAQVEALLGWREFALVAPQRPSAAVTKAAQAAVRHWMRQQGHDGDGFYSMAQWQEYYNEAMRATG